MSRGGLISSQHNRTSTGSPVEDSILSDVDIIDEDMLRALASEDNLNLITTLEMRVALPDDTLPPIGTMAPNLTRLKLGGSDLPTLRCLGTSLRCVTSLWVRNSRVATLDGIQFLPQLRELYAAFNMIESTSPIASLQHIVVVDLEANPIRTLEDSVYPLSLVTTLSSLSFEGCPVQYTEGYRACAKEAMPFLTCLDDVDVTADGATSQQGLSSQLAGLEDEIALLQNAIRDTRDIGVESLVTDEKRVFEAECAQVVASRRGSSRNGTSLGGRPPSSRMLRPGTASSQSSGVPTPPASASSTLTSQTNVVFTGNLTRILRARKDAGEENMRALGSELNAAGTTPEEVLLRHVASWKQDAARHVDLYDRTETNVLSLDCGDDDD
eukprot:PhM_4_TR6973/c0_g1_i1/m.6289